MRTSTRRRTPSGDTHQIRKISDHLLLTASIQKSRHQEVTSPGCYRQPSRLNSGFCLSPSRCAVWSTDWTASSRNSHLKNNHFKQLPTTNWPGMRFPVRAHVQKKKKNTWRKQTGSQYLSCQQLPGCFLSKRENVGVSVNKSSWMDKKENVFLEFSHEKNRKAILDLPS